MRIIKEGEDFDLPIDFETQITKYNVMLTDAGEQSNPITLPSTARNLRMVDYSNRLDAYYKPVSDVDVLFVNGFRVRPANLGIHTVDVDDGISCTLYIGTGDFYSKVGNTRLNWLSWPVVKSPTYETDSEAERVGYLISMLKQQFIEMNPLEQYKVAPVLTGQEIEWFDGGVSRKRPFVLNGFEDYYWKLPAQGDVDINVFQGEYVHSKIDGDNVVTLNKGYGMTPFLKLGYVLGFVFGKFGYTFDSSEIDIVNSGWLQDTVILNNVADAIYSGVLKYSQLVPDMLISEFLKETERLLAGKFIVDEATKSIKFRFYKNMLTNEVGVDLTLYLSSPLKVKEPTFKIIKITEAEKLTESAESDDEVERFEFDLLKAEYVEILFADNFVEADGSVFFKLIKIDNIIYLNSDFVVNGETTESEDKAATSLQLMAVPDLWNDVTILDVDSKELTIRYRESYPFMSLLLAYTSLDKLKWLYAEYIEFHKNSNIPFEATMMIPDRVFEMIDVHVPVLVDGHKLLIEYLKKATNNANGSVITEGRFRTLRSYVGR